ncbi:MAG: VOC family protein [bacterium]|nr:VOC family protein [bacterium]
MVSGFWHVGVTVASMERSLIFYRDHLGLGQVSDRIVRDGALLAVVAAPATGLRVCMLQIPGSDSYVELVEYLDCGTSVTHVDVSSPGTGHLCLYVEDLREVWERLSRAGVEAISPGPVDCSSRIPETWCMYLRDPDGYPVELFQGPRYPAGRRVDGSVAT